MLSWKQRASSFTPCWPLSPPSRIHERVLQLAVSLSEADWERGMHYPTRWDPRFADFMRFEDVLRWSVAHLRHYKTQLRPSPGGR
ncbi:MAG TPA: hypothetical protein VGD27_01985 [Longimicrobiales bacterium]